MTTIALLGGAYAMVVFLVVMLLRAGTVADEMSEAPRPRSVEDTEPSIRPEQVARHRRFRRSARAPVASNGGPVPR